MVEQFINRSDIRDALVAALVEVSAEWDRRLRGWPMTAEKVLPLVVMSHGPASGCVVYREGTSLPDYSDQWGWEFWAAVDASMKARGFDGYTESINCAVYTWRLDG